MPANTGGSHSDPDLTHAGPPRSLVHRVTGPLQGFLHIEAASGVILLAATLAALALANSRWAGGFHAFWETPVELTAGAFHFRETLKHLINDGLMAIFFFVVGLEVKHELVLGELRDVRRAALPIAAALGGMVAPAGIYLALQWGEPAARGWGVPMATDIAFVVGCMALLGSRVPHSLRIMLLTLAIADDIGAILVIAIGYTDDLAWNWLLNGAVGIGVVHVFARIGVRSFAVYTLAGTFVWYSFLESGVHATVAGVILGLMTPARSHVSTGLAAQLLDRGLHLIRGEEWETLKHRGEQLRRLQYYARESISPLEYLESLLHPWVSFVIMPVFALANAGVPVQASDLGAPVAVAVMLALVVGKPLGIVLFSWLSVRAGLARLPEGVGWSLIAGGGCLAGIGFTMALFVAELALREPMLSKAKIGVLTGSALSAFTGMALLLAITRRKEP